MTKQLGTQDIRDIISTLNYYYNNDLPGKAVAGMFAENAQLRAERDEFRVELAGLRNEYVEVVDELAAMEATNDN